MILVADTSVPIDHLRGDERAHATIRGAVRSGQTPVASALTKTEVFAGMRPAEEAATRSLLGSLQWVGVDDRKAERAGMLANQYLQSHPDIDVVDCVIAATTQLLGAELWTLNFRRCPMFPRLNPPY